MNSPNKNFTNLISLSDFKVLSNISDSKIIYLLDMGLLPISLDEKGHLFINLEELSIEELGIKLIEKKKDFIKEEDRVIFEEIIAKEALVFYEEILEEAFKIINKKPVSS